MMRKLLFCALVFNLLLANVGNAESLKTRYGTVSEDGAGQLHLGKKLLHDADGNNIYLQGSFQLKDKDVVLFNSHCGGSGCVEQSFYLLTVSKGGASKKFKLGDFSMGVEATTRVEGERLKVVFSPENGKQETVVFDGEKPTKAVKRVKSKAELSKENCQWVYKYADSCVDAGQNGNDCNAKLRDDFPGWSARGIAELDDSYKPAAFDKACRSMCLAKRKNMGFDAFAKSVCKS